MASTDEIVLSEAQRRAILDNLEKWPERTCQVRLSFLPFEPKGKFDKIVGDHVGEWRHVEISFEVDGPIGAIAFSAWSGHFPPLPDNAGLGSKALRWAQSWLQSPPIMRGTWVAPRTFSNSAYTHIGFNVSSRLEASLFRACERLHGAPFNSNGYYRTILPRVLQRTTTRDCFFCSEAVLTALQDSDILPTVLDEEAMWIADANPGSVTPSMLYDALAPYGIVVMNQMHSIDTSVGVGVVPTFFAASADADSEW